MQQSLQEKRNGYMRKYRSAYPERFKGYDLKKKFGITFKQYSRLLEQQGGVCAICKNPEFAVDHRTGEVRSLAVDHNHATGMVRGLLCTNCNKAVGHLKDDPKIAKACLEYIEVHAPGA